MKKRFLALTMALVLCLCLLPMTAMATSEIEPNDTYQTATAISLNTMVAGSFTNSWDYNNRTVYDYDWYKVTLTQPGRLQLQFSKPAGRTVDARISCLNQSGGLTQIYGKTMSALSNPVLSHETVSCDNLYLPVGDYYIELYANTTNDSTSDYTITVAYEAITNGSLELEPNGEYSNATAIPANLAIRGSFTNSWDYNNRTVYDYDWFKITLTQSGGLQLVFNRPSNRTVYVNISAVNQSGALAEIYNKTIAPVPNAVAEYTTVECDRISLSAGDYYIRVYASNPSNTSNSESNYTMTALAPEESVRPSPPPTTAPESPSSWALNEVNAAINIGLVPANLQKNYTISITRGAAAQMFINLIEKASGQTIDDFMVSRGVTINNNAFTDTNDKAVLAANALGVIQGVGNNRFDPDGVFTRAHVAVIINRVARALGLQTEGYNHTFTDVQGHWASSELGWPVHVGVIQGMGNNKFDPDANLTTEMVIVTAYRALAPLSQ